MPAATPSPTPSPAPIFPSWRAEHSTHWNRRPLAIEHTLHTHALFGTDALAALIDRYPADDCALVQTRRDESGARRWREGRIGAVPGREVIASIARHSLWLNLRDVGRHSPAHAALMEAAYAEIAGHVPGFDARAIKIGILISSPLAQVPYHCDLPGQALWQIGGRKTVRVYPAAAPYLTPQALEDIAYSGFEFKLDYEPAFDANAEVCELAPGRMLTWPLNAPHRVDNHDCLNVSVTTEHWTDANRRSQRLLVANGLLRHRLHWEPASRALSGPGYWAKSALQAAWRRSPWAAATQRAHRPVEFDLAPDAADGVAELAAPR